MAVDHQRPRLAGNYGPCQLEQCVAGLAEEPGADAELLGRLDELDVAALLGDQDAGRVVVQDAHIQRIRPQYFAIVAGAVGVLGPFRVARIIRVRARADDQVPYRAQDDRLVRSNHRAAAELQHQLAEVRIAGGALRLVGLGHQLRRVGDGQGARQGRGERRAVVAHDDEIRADLAARDGGAALREAVGDRRHDHDAGDERRLGRRHGKLQHRPGVRRDGESCRQQ